MKTKPTSELTTVIAEDMLTLYALEQSRTKLMAGIADLDDRIASFRRRIENMRAKAEGAK